MAEITVPQLRCIKGMVRKLNVDGATVAVGFSQGRTEHVSELTRDEATEMIKHLKGMDPEEKQAEVMRRKIIGMAYTRAGLAQTASKEDKRRVVNQLDEWCKQYGHGKKALNSYRYAELPKLVTQYEHVLKDLLIKV
jgi:formyltetrahydrofolate hydrolase